MELYLALVGTHLFLATIYLVLLSYDHESSRAEKIKNAALAFLVPIVGTLYACGLFRRRGQSHKDVGSSSYKDAIGITAVGLVGPGVAGYDHFSPSLDGGCGGSGAGGGDGCGD